MSRLTNGAKIALLLIAGLAIFFGLKLSGVLDSIEAPASDETTTKGSSDRSNSTGDMPVVKIGVVTWGGYAGGQYFNNGFDPNPDSRYRKDYGFDVEFKVMDDFNASRNAFKSGDIDLLWTTVDAYTTEAPAMTELGAKLVMQADWSRGGDAIVVRRGIDKVSDLKNKKVAVASMTPSHTFLLYLLKAASMGNSDVNIVEVNDAIEAASMFKSGNVDAAVVWSPDDMDCVNKVKGSKILESTRNASHIIADGFIAKESWIEQNEQILTDLVEGWMIGAKEINSSQANKEKAAKILAEGLEGMDYDLALKSINNVRLTTIGDNAQFFDIDHKGQGVTAEKLYDRSANEYIKAGYLKQGDKVPFRSVAYSKAIAKVNERLTGPGHEAEGAKEFKKVESKAKVEEAAKKAITKLSVTINFSTGSAILSEDAKYTIDKEFAEIAESFGNTRILIEGNTDKTGSDKINIPLSKKRAQSVADYLVKEHGFDSNKFIVIGNGSKNNVKSTDMKLLPEGI